MISLPKYALTVIAAVGTMLMAPVVLATPLYTITYTGVVQHTNACTYASTTDCYAPVGSTISGSFTYATGAAGAQYPTQDFYRNLITDYSLSIPSSGYSGSYSDAAGFGRFSTNRNAPTQAAATSSGFTAYVSKYAGSYTFLGGTNTVDFSPRLATSAAVASDNFYGDMMVADIRVNFGALTGLFADLAVPTTFSFADLDPSVTNFGITLVSDLYLGNLAAYTFGGGLTSVTVTPVTTSSPVLTSFPVPEPATLALFAMGLFGLGFVRRPSILAQ